MTTQIDMFRHKNNFNTSLTDIGETTFMRLFSKIAFILAVQGKGRRVQDGEGGL